MRSPRKPRRPAWKVGDRATTIGLSMKCKPTLCVVEIAEIYPESKVRYLTTHDGRKTKQDCVILSDGVLVIYDLDDLSPVMEG